MIERHEAEKKKDSFDEADLNVEVSSFEASASMIA
jgi:hypothetical protein